MFMYIFYTQIRASKMSYYKVVIIGGDNSLQRLWYSLISEIKRQTSENYVEVSEGLPIPSNAYNVLPWIYFHNEYINHNVSQNYKLSDCIACVLMWMFMLFIYELSHTVVK